MDYRDFYGKYWGYTPRQWRNLGVRFQSENKGYLDPACVLDALTENGDRLGYIMLYAQISILMTEISKGNDLLMDGVIPEILYDRWTWKSTKLSASIYDKNGKIKPCVAASPHTHVFNVYRKWMKQLVHDIYNHIGRDEHRTFGVYERMRHMDPVKMAQWLDTFPECWGSNWAYEKFPENWLQEYDLDSVELEVERDDYAEC